jgi:hypothetical protein
LKQGADIVIAGRVADAAPTVGAAIWWHGWDRSNLDELAGALMAGHIIECSAYATGGYYAGFKDLMENCENLGFPIATIEANGEVEFTKGAGPGGEMSVGTATSQLLYEIQGPYYFNSDVVADIEGLTLTQVGKDQVRMTGIKGLPPPPTTKVGITSETGKLWQAEFHFFFVGLDIEEKVRILRRIVYHTYCPWISLLIYATGEMDREADSVRYARPHPQVHNLKVPHGRLGSRGCR